MADVSEALRERLKDRFWGSFLIAFLVVNWRAAYVLLFPSSQVEFFDRLAWVEDTLYSVWWITLLRTLLIPLLLCSFSIAAVPWLSNILERWRYMAFIARQNNQVTLDQKRIANEIELQTIKSTNSRLERERDDLRKELGEQKRVLDQEKSQWSTTELGRDEDMKRHYQALQRVLELSGVDRRYIAFTSRPERDPKHRSIRLLEAADAIRADGHSWYKLTDIGEHILELWPPKGPDQP